MISEDFLRLLQQPYKPYKWLEKFNIRHMCGAKRHDGTMRSLQRMHTMF